MVAKVEAFKASDGTIHSTEEAACRRELKCLLGKILDSNKFSQKIPSTYTLMMMDMLVDNATEVNEAFISYVKSLPKVATPQTFREFKKPNE